MRTDFDRASTPYVVLIHPGKGSAVLNRDYGLISERASDTLIAWARAHHTQRRLGWAGEPHQRPRWLLPGDEPAVELFWLFKDRTPLAEIRAIPAG
jgi:hypothetical protein